MYPDDLVFGLVAADSLDDPGVGLRLRDLTLSWARYDYRGPIIEGAGVDEVLAEAREREYRFCVVLAPGHVVVERWDYHGRADRFAERVRGWCEREVVRIVGLDDGHTLVDLRAAGSALPRYLGNGIREFPGLDAGASAGAAAFLGGVAAHVATARRGVFLWNLEAYDDVREAPSGFEAPLETMYAVAAGFKANVALEALGFDADTEVVYFDYSEEALEVKQLLLEHWDGRDFPSFTRLLFARLPRAHFHLWAGATPETVEPWALECAWQNELETWGGEDAFAAHWERYRALRHDFVHCDVVDDPAPLLARVRRGVSDAIWWSNAFFTVGTNWLHPIGERVRRYERFVSGLAARNPDLFVFGADPCNASVNDVRAGDYLGELAHARPDGLLPLRVARQEIRF